MASDTTIWYTRWVPLTVNGVVAEPLLPNGDQKPKPTLEVSRGLHPLASRPVPLAFTMALAPGVAVATSSAPPCWCELACGPPAPPLTCAQLLSVEHRCRFWPARLVVRKNISPAEQVAGSVAPLLAGFVRVAAEASRLP